MSDSTQETVIVRDPEGLRKLDAADAWTTMTLVGALSADPRSFDELARAWLRYRPDDPLEHLPWVDSHGELTDGPWLLLDLACLRIVAGGGAELPESPAAFQRDEGPWSPDIPVIWINLPPNWQCIRAADGEQVLPPLPVPSEPLDVRGVLFGKALAEGIARRTLQIARHESLPSERVSWSNLDRDESPSESQREQASLWHALTIRVHADWLMTPRQDLESQPPRPFLHRGRDWVDHELHNRQMQWSNERRAPRGLDRDTFAYRYGPLGRHEVVMYFDLCREVIGAAWDRVFQTRQIEEAALAKVLHEHAQRWLTEGSIDGDPTPPAVIIENERRRMPLVGDGSHLDCDCPLCRMEGEGGLGPMFCGFDGHHLDLDNEFAFSLCATRAEWEAEQEEYRQFSESMDTQRSQREAEAADDADSFDSVWTSSYVDEESLRGVSASSPLLTMALAMRVAEMVGDLKSAGASPDLIETLNSAFDDYRAAGEDLTLSAAAISQLVEALEQIASAQPHLTAKAADLQSQLDERRRRTDSNDPF